MARPLSVERAEVSAYTVPTDAPEADGTFTWTETTMVLVRIWADGQVGTGWTYGSVATATLIRQTLAPMLIGRPVTDIGRIWPDLRIALRNIGYPGIGSMAVSATDCALWDLKARVLGLPLHRLLGAVRDAVPIYGSGGFTSYDDEQLAAQLAGWVHDDHLTRVKIKIGEAWGTDQDRDLARVRQARDGVGDQGELYVDAIAGYTVAQAVRMSYALDTLDVTWFEEPVSSDDLAGLRRVREGCQADVTAGEYGYSLDYFARMAEAGAVDCLQVDATRCGGISELLRITPLAAAHHLDISGHCAPYQHLAVLAAVPNLRHLEWFHDHVRIEQLFFDGADPPRDSALHPPESVGNGLTWRPDAASPFQVF
ncbi:enolase C-terminal domain-like protein [Microlunatus ginsengisoli]|uniref:Enolase C-terminal domain-like protein n=1 Tax=Microlunatus ginsengisoli TaxID=363863 RepID=A0ABP6ZCS4_9ACTN